MRSFKFSLSILLTGVLLLSGCQNNIFQNAPAAPEAMSAIPAIRLNFRYEADVPAPSIEAGKSTGDERDAGVQADFDAARSQELLDRTIASPDRKRILAVYHNVTDIQSEFRLDMYSPEGKLLKKITSDAMAVHFPDTIVWSPDSNSVAFVAMTRATPPEIDGNENSPANTKTRENTNRNSAADESNSESTPAASPADPALAAPTGILTFRAEQIYICDADGNGAKAVTVNDGLIYFYYAWSPDSTMLAALAATSFEWRRADLFAASKGEMMIPYGRLRLIERNGRERRLDDNPTQVRPVWSPDGSKVATAYDSQIRIYDAMGTNPTQAAIPLRNQLLLSSQAYDREQQRILQTSGDGVDVNANTPPVSDQSASTLPDPALLVSYNPIVEIAWTADDLLYLQTAYVRRMKNEADSVRSFSRWHRLALSAQSATPAK